SILLSPSSTLALIPSCCVSSSNVKSSIDKRKKGALGGSRAISSLEARLFSPRAPIPCQGVGSLEEGECPSGGNNEGIVSAAHSLAFSRKGRRSCSSFL